MRRLFLFHGKRNFKGKTPVPFCYGGKPLCQSPRAGEQVDNAEFWCWSGSFPPKMHRIPTCPRGEDSE